jgi:hypothetical protein
MNKPDADDDIRQLLERDDTRTGAQHDEAVLAAARSTAGSGRSEHPAARAGQPPASLRQWKIPAALAATFAAGAVLGLAFGVIDRPDVPGRDDSGLLLPLDTTRGSEGRAIAVEQAAPEDWYRYIQELIVAGETQEAERHLHRFNELHPDYAHQP